MVGLSPQGGRGSTEGAILGAPELTSLFIFSEHLPVVRFPQLFNDTPFGIIQGLWVAEGPVYSLNLFGAYPSHSPTPEEGRILH